MSLKMGLLGRKIGMTQVFHDDGTALGVTAVSVGPCVVVGKRTPDKHGYAAVQLGFEEYESEQQLARQLNRPLAGFFKKANVEKPLRLLREVRLDPKDVEKYEVGKVLRAAEVFKPGDVVDVTGTTKGKGYQGVMKKHRMAGDTMTHGTHEFFRHGGSIGCRLTPGRVHKGKRMSGLMGNVKNTASDLIIVKVLEDKDVVLVKGAIPGPANGVVLIKGSVKDVKKYIVPRAIKEVESKNPMKASKKGGGGGGGGGGGDKAKPAKK
jgi:large subunit ribosomal protein L3